MKFGTEVGHHGSFQKSISASSQVSFSTGLILQILAILGGNLVINAPFSKSHIHNNMASF